MTRRTLVETVADYAAELELVRQQGFAESESLQALRRRAADAFQEQGFPTSRQEGWRFTSVAPFARTRFEPPSGELSAEIAEQIDAWRYAGMAQAVVVDGCFAPQLSRLEGLADGLLLEGLEQASKRGVPGFDAFVGRHARFDGHPFLALNTALFRDGIYLLVPPGTVVERPIQLLFVSTAGSPPARSFPRAFILAGENSQAMVFESYVGLGEEAYFSCPVTEIFLEPGAVMDHYRLQKETEASFHVAAQQIHLERDSSFSSSTVTLSGGLVRNDVNAALVGEGSECALNGLYLTSGRQHVDNQMRVDHVAPHCSSHELYKGVLEGGSRAVFNGLIHVHPGAQKTDAVQTNRNLLLSREALVNTNPQLEIYADDVKCTHGSTVGQIDEDAVFYLRSRGIGEEAARSLLTWAFAGEIVEAIRLAPLRAELEDHLISRLPTGEVVRQAIEREHEPAP
jgi:Fe-S cluster assembly protein SufD